MSPLLFPADPQVLPQSTAPRAIVFIEADVHDYQTLLAGLAPDTEVHLLGAGEDGLARMAQVLEGRSGIDALHIVSHGSEGMVSLGTLQLNTEVLAARAGELATIRAALAPDADILLYGCAVGAGTDGAAFVAELARASGADVAASTDATGSVVLGGNWVLERTTGSIGSYGPFSSSALRDYSNLLAPSGTANGTYDFSDTIGAFNSGGSGFVKIGDKFVISNGIARDPGDTAIWFDSGPGVASASMVIKAEGGAVAKTFSFQDLTLSLYEWQNNVSSSALNALQIITKDTLGIPISTYTMPGPYSPGTTTPFKASMLLNGGAAFSDNNVASITINWTIGVNPDYSNNPGSAEAWNLLFESITIANVSATLPPAPPSAPDLAPLDDSGTLTSDNITNATLLSFSGTSAPADNGGTVRVFLDKNNNGVYDAGTDPTGSATTGNGAWTVSGIDAASLSDGVYQAYAQVSNGGQTSAVGTALNVTIDRSSPAVAITSDKSTLKAGETATITFTFSEDPGATFTWNGGSGDVIVSGGTLSAISGTGLTRSATFTPTNGVNGGTASIGVSAGSYADLAGNIGGSGSAPSIGFDTLAPAVNSIVRANATPSKASAVQYTVTFDSSVSGVDAGDFQLTTTGTAAGSIGSVSGSGSTYTVTVNGISGDGTMRLDLKSSATGIVDAGGNAAGGYTGGQAYTFDHTAPAVNSVAVPASATYRTGQNLDFTVNFNETVVVDTAGGTPALALTLDTGGTVQAFYVGGSGSTALSFRYTVASGQADNNGVALGASIALGGATIRDAAGNDVATALNNVGSTSGVLVAALAPTVSAIERAGQALTQATSVDYTVTFSESVTGVDASDFTLTGSGVSGSIAGVSGSGSTYTVTVDNISGDGPLRLDLNPSGTGIVNASSQGVSGGFTAGQSYTIDQTAPLLATAISISDTGLKIGDGATLTFVFTEAVTGFTSADVTVPNGTLSNLASNDGGITWTATLTPAAGVNDSSNLLTLNYGGIADLAGNAGSGTADSGNYAVDTVRPSLASSIAISDTVLAIGGSATVSFHFTEAVTGFTAADVSVANGTLSSLASSDGGVTWTATLTPAAGTSDTSNVLTLNYGGIADLAGNTGSGSVDSGSYSVDTVRPSLASPIAISDTTLTIGESATVSFSFTEAVSGFTVDDVSVPNGSLSNLASSDGGRNWTATLQPASGASSASNVLTLDYAGIADLAGNAGSGSASSGNYAVQTTVPVLAAPITISDTALKAGDSATVSFVFNEAVTGFTVADVSVPSGALSGLSSIDGGVTWTATLSPAAATTAASNVLTLDTSGIANLAGNAGSGTVDSGNYAVDTVRPSLASSIATSDTALKLGDTAAVTFTFTEAVTGFTVDDVSVPNGTLSNLSSIDGGLTWTATLLPTAGASGAANALTLDYAGIADLAGNAGMGTADSANYSVDTVRPALGSGITISDTALRIGESATVTFSFTEAVAGFTTDDVSVPNGSLSNLASNDGGITWTATLLPTAGASSAADMLTLDYAGIADLAGNAGSGSVDSATYAVDTLAPTATVTLSDNDLRAGETALVTVRFNEAVSGFGNAAVSAGNGSLDAFASSDGGLSWSARFTPAADTTAPANVVTVSLAGVVDAAGNPGAGSVASASYAVRTAPPQKPPTSSTVDGVMVVSQPGPVDPATGVAGSTLTVPVITANRPDDPNSAHGNLADIPLGLGGPDGARTELLVSLPTGTGMQVEGPAALLDNSQALIDLIHRIESKTAVGSSVQAEMSGQGSGFLRSLAPNTLLESKTVVLMAQAGSGTPHTILINGGSTTPVDGGSNATAIGLVLDASALPGGSVLQLNNVDFAAVIGAATLRGGAGRNYVVGDDARQNILLGADDDVLMGGGGDDLIGSAGGNDRLDGGDGADIVVGGIGGDSLAGGAGDDLLQGGRSSQGGWQFYLDATGTLKAQHDTALFAPGQTESVTLAELDGSAEGLSFLAADKAMLSSLSLLYHAAFGRAPDLAGLAYWAGGSADLGVIAQLLLQSAEWRNTSGAALSDAAFVEALYQNAFGRAPDSAGQDYWSAQLAGGAAAAAMSRAEVMQAFAQSAEHALAWNTADGYLIGTGSVGLENGWIAGSGDDRLEGGAGSDVLVGGDGVDTAVYAGTMSDYRFIIDSAGHLKVDSKANGDVDALFGIERGAFGDGELDLGFLQGNLAQLTRLGLLYQAVLDRAGDLGGFQWWLARDLGGDQLVHDFTQTAEFKSRYDGVDDAAFVKALYDNSGLGAGAAGGQAYWEAYLASHTRAELIGQWLQTGEVANAQFAGHGLWLV
ncbi:DUF4347 domain-containing protein [Massilia sp. UMI-21]|nr:DUF4347 domain-containing protein [Massilia sp. UMI-21]